MTTSIEKSHCSAAGNNGLPTRTIRTFLADDVPLLLALLAKIVSKDRRVAIVGSASDGRKALGDASTLGPDLVVTDLHMPGLDGAEVTRQLKQRLNPPTVFVLTSDDRPESRARCLAAGADAFLVKGTGLASQLQAAIQLFFPSTSR